MASPGAADLAAADWTAVDFASEAAPDLPAAEAAQVFAPADLERAAAAAEAVNSERSAAAAEKVVAEPAVPAAAGFPAEDEAAGDGVRIFHAV